MIVRHFSEITNQAVETDDAVAVTIRWLIGKDNTDALFYMRQLEIAPDGHTPYHRHGGGHQVYILQGEGRLRTETGYIPLSPGTFAQVLPEDMHSFENTGATPFRFLCLIPRD